MIRWLGQAFRRLGNWLMDRGGEPDHDDSSCSFCFNHRLNVEYLIAGPNGIYICENCIETCRGILVESGWYRRQEGVDPSTDETPSESDENGET